jgi:hypothetical protein
VPAVHTLRQPCYQAHLPEIGLTVTLVPLRRLLAALAAFVVLLVAGQAVALADNIVADGDGVAPVASQSLAFGNVPVGQ